jgi:hypothetical protein
MLLNNKFFALKVAYFNLPNTLDQYFINFLSIKALIKVFQPSNH